MKHPSAFGLMALTFVMVLTLLFGLLMTMAFSVPVSKPLEPMAPPMQQTAQAESVVSGVVASVDPANLMIVMKTRFGAAKGFSVANADMLKGVAEGDAITVELDQQGVARKLTKSVAGTQGVPAP